MATQQQKWPLAGPRPAAQPPAPAHVETPDGQDLTPYIQLLQGRPYLNVAGRVLWFRGEVTKQPEWGIETHWELLDIEGQVAVCTATVKDETGRVRAQATKMETAKGFADFVEKAQTGAVGRALALCGFGTQFALDMDEGGKPVDSPAPPRPVAAPATGNNGTKAKAEPPLPATPTAAIVAPGVAAAFEAQRQAAEAPVRPSEATPMGPATELPDPFAGDDKAPAAPAVCATCGAASTRATLDRCQQLGTPPLCNAHALAWNRTRLVKTQLLALNEGDEAAREAASKTLEGYSTKWGAAPFDAILNAAEAELTGASA